MNGKGDRPRPTNMSEYGQNFDKIDWGHDYLECLKCGVKVKEQDFIDHPEKYTVYDEGLEHVFCPL